MAIWLPTRSKPHTQPEPTMCLPTCFKNILDNQFGGIVVPLSKINKAVGYDGRRQNGVAVETFHSKTTKLLKPHKIEVSLTENNSISDIIKLLESGVFPIVFFRLQDYNKWAGQDGREVDPEGPVLHALLITGVDEDNETIYVFDPIYHPRREYSSFETASVGVPQFKYLEFWVDEGLVYPLIFATKGQAPPITKPKDQRTIGEALKGTAGTGAEGTG